MLLDVHGDSLKNRSNSIAVTCRNVGRNPKGLNPSAGYQSYQTQGGWYVVGYIFVFSRGKIYLLTYQ